MIGKDPSWPVFKERHLLQIAAARDLSPIGCRTGIVLNSYLNHETRDCWPSETTIARDLGYDVGQGETDVATSRRDRRSS